MTIYAFERYHRSLKRLDANLRKLVEQRVAIFRANPFDVRLDTHQLHGKLKKQCSFSVDKRCRILFEFFDKKKTEVVFLDIGDHSIYR